MNTLFDKNENTLKKLSNHLSDDISEALILFGKEKPHEQLEQFAICRFESIDNIPEDFEETTGHYWDCGVRNSCPFEGIICGFLRYEGIVLTPLEVKILQLVSTELSNAHIEQVLKLKKSAFDLKKSQLYSKLKISTKQAAARIATELNIISKWSERKTIKELLTS